MTDTQVFIVASFVAGFGCGALVMGLVAAVIIYSFRYGSD